MRVLVTGGCGFIGSHVCEFYAKRGDTVVAFDNMTKYELGRTGYAAEAARNYNWDYLRSIGVSTEKADIRNFDRLMEHAEGSDFIVHTAAQPAMTLSIENPELDFSTNARGTFNVLRVAKELGIPIVSCSTIHVYGNRINDTLREDATRYVRVPPDIDESHPVVEGILTPLHASKRAAELYVETFIKSYKVHAASFRLTGLYGPRQFAGEDHGWVANFCIRAVLDWPLKIFGSGKQLRDILYATDVVKAFHAFYEHGKPGTYNIGGGIDFSISLLECIDVIADFLGKKPQVTFESGRLGDLLYFVCDTKKAERELKWKPEVPPKVGIENLINWIKSEETSFNVKE
jgi:CDP-paratose 2-epimerase